MQILQTRRDSFTIPFLVGCYPSRESSELLKFPFRVQRHGFPLLGKALAASERAERICRLDFFFLCAEKVARDSPLVVGLMDCDDVYWLLSLTRWFMEIW